MGSENKNGKKMVVSHDASLPGRLFYRKEINALKDVDDSLWNKSGRIYLLVKNDESAHELVAAGASVDRFGVFVKKDSVINFSVLDKYLPFSAKKTIVPIVGDLIPNTSWGASLYNMLTKSAWDKIRQRAFAATAGRCEICGSSSELECHEVWEYHEPIKSLNIPVGCTVFGVQKLVRLMPVCEDCHLTHHLGFANVSGRLDDALSRIKAFNRFSDGEMKEYYKFVASRHAKRSEYGWALDLSILRDEILVVQNKWRLDGDGFLSAETQSNNSVTMILGVAWKYAKGGEINDPVSPDIAYYE